MTEERISYYQRQILAAQNEQAYWQSKIDQAPPSTNHSQLDHWRDRVQLWKRQERVYRVSLEKLPKDER